MFSATLVFVAQSYFEFFTQHGILGYAALGLSVAVVAVLIERFGYVMGQRSRSPFSSGRFCPHCGRAVATADAVFCAYCGASLRSAR